jgi:hypothetical protein
VAITWVNGTAFAQGESTSFGAATPSGLADDDTLIAAVYHRSTITTPSGWTKLYETTALASFGNQRLAVFSKDAVASSDASTTVTWVQSSFARIGVVYAAMRGADVEVQDAQLGTKETYVSAQQWKIACPVVTSAAANQCILVFATSFVGYPTCNAAAPAGFTIFSGNPVESYRLSGAYRITSGSSESSAGDYVIDTSPTYDHGANGLAAVSILFGQAAPVECYISAQSPIGQASLVGAHSFGSILLDGPLGAPRLLGNQSFAVASAASPLGAPSLLGWHDFTGAIDPDAPLRYVCDLTTPDGTVRVPISSWQATLQTDISCYSQCVIPAVEPYVDAIIAATNFAVYRQVTLSDGATIEYLMTEAEPDAPAFARGPYRYTCTLSGYSPALVAENDPSSTFDRTLQNVRQTAQNGSTYRVQCDIDVLLRPGHRAFVGETSFVVRYINYVVNTQGQSMQVGSASNGA